MRLDELSNILQTTQNKYFSIITQNQDTFTIKCLKDEIDTLEASSEMINIYNTLKSYKDFFEINISFDSIEIKEKKR